ncbi:arylsulfatase [Rubritalea tangerina]|uniref:Arylsulfatase n=2 Tax=Rubritalea tangerina TaxID=430798 RepID=A0ABW4Z6L7_9BACT
MFKSVLIAACALIIPATLSANSKKPNIIFVMVDDAGLGDFTNYGGKHIKTPVMERMAKQGLQFNNAYSGNAVCGPTRCTLMTGLHPGHAIRRANKSLNGLLPLSSDSVTVASVLKKQGYATGGFGKWGLGNVGTTGVPEKQGFDLWYGYYDQKHAHNYYPSFLVRNSKEEPLKGNANNKKQQYTHYLIEEETLKFIDKNKDHPFFCYAAWTPPHGQFVIPANDPNLAYYKDKPWSQTVKNYAAMVSLLDAGVGRILERLEKHGIAENTLVVYTSDNGANGQFIKALNSNAGLKGGKRSLYEGGIRAPFVAYWPGTIKPNTSTDALVGQLDLLETAAEMAGVKNTPPNDGISFLPLLLGKQQPSPHPFLYFEIYEGAFQQCVRMGNWKGYRKGLKDPVALYDLSKDPSETTNVADKHPDVAKQLETILTREHSPTPNYKAPDHAKGAKKNKNKKNS